MINHTVILYLMQVHKIPEINPSFKNKLKSMTSQIKDKFNKCPLKIWLMQ